MTNGAGLPASYDAGTYTVTGRSPPTTKCRFADADDGRLDPATDGVLEDDPVEGDPVEQPMIKTAQRTVASGSFTPLGPRRRQRFATMSHSCAGGAASTRLVVGGRPGSPRRRLSRAGLPDHASVTRAYVMP
jgi:hypothetical protein